ncbi:MAG: hypothetical protein A2007_04280 [Verrucomicrobia bacterium GWC2_42_7]|nr:MAG: hypothetical protein A2007_04280 [Verrucomicrobia bacterium GWC2_42_7]
MITLRKVALLALLFFTSNAFAWHEEFNTKIGTVVHGDTFVAIGGIRGGKSISFSGGSSFNGIQLREPLFLEVNMDRDQFIAAMEASGILTSSNAQGKEDMRAPTSLGIRFFNEGKYDEAIPYLKKGAELGDSESQNLLGLCYIKGWGVMQDSVEGIRLFELAARQGHSRAIANLGTILSNEDKYAEAVPYLQKGAELGDSEAQFGLGLCYIKGWGVMQDSAEGIRLFELAARQGNPRAIATLGAVFYNEDKYAEAIPYLKRVAELGDSESLYLLGVCYIKGWGVMQDRAEGIRLFELAARQGHPKAIGNLGVALYNEHKYTEAIPYLKRGVELGQSEALNSLGVCYIKGLGVMQDSAEGIRLFELAARQGHSRAIANLGAVLSNEHKYAEAIPYLKRGAELGQSESLNSLGLCYINGWGVMQDSAEGIRLFKLAAEQGHPKAIANLGTILSNEHKYAEAIPYLKRGAELGDSEAQFGLGLCYINGWGVIQDSVEGIRLFELAARQGNPRAIANLGEASFDEHK